MSQMNMHSVTQGSQEWIELRAGYFTASEAPAMLGLSKYKTRAALLREKATGIVAEVDAGTQRRFNDGHAAEAAARPIAESIIGEEIYPVTGSLAVDGLLLLASFDGLTMGEDVCWESKLWNEEFAAFVRDKQDAPDTHWPQLEQQLLVSGASKCLFTVSDGTPERTVTLWYESRPERRAQLIAGWKQFREDLAHYQHVEEKPAIVVADIDALPALTVELSGQVLSSNLVPWKEAVVARIQAINTDLQTDEDFAVADKMTKFLGEGEKRLELVKHNALAQTSTIDELFRTIDTLRSEMRAKRLNLERLVSARKDAVREEIRVAGVSKWNDHMAMLTARLGSGMMPTVPVDFAGAMKGKKTVSSLRDAVETELARAKIAASEIADRIQANLNAYADLAAGHEFLFADLSALVNQPKEAFMAIVENRIGKHKEEEAKRQEEEREKIRAEARAKAEADAQQPPRASAPSLDQVLAVAAPEPIAKAIVGAPQADDGKTIKLGDINSLLGFTVTAEFLQTMGFVVVRTEKNAKLYRQCDLPAICDAIARHVSAIGRTAQAAA